MSETVVNCPFCDDSFDAEKSFFFEDDNGEDFLVCPLCESVIPFEDLVEDPPEAEIREEVSKAVGRRDLRRRALDESIRLYWDEGKSIDFIKGYLNEDLKVKPRDLLIVMEDLGNVIGKFGSDVNYEVIKSLMYG